MIIAFVTLLPAVFWHYFTSLGALLAVTCIESSALRFTAMGFYLASSIWGSCRYLTRHKTQHATTRHDMTPTTHDARHTPGMHAHTHAP
jgi:hypothetical protein